MLADRCRRPRPGGAGSPSGYGQRWSAGSRGQPDRARMAWGAPHNDDLWRRVPVRVGIEPGAAGTARAEAAGGVARVLGNPTDQVQAETAATVAASQNGNPNALTEFATFELNPWETRTANGVWQGPVHGSWNVSADEAWYRNMAAGIGSARALVIEQVDLPFALKILLDSARADRHLRRPGAERQPSHHGLHRWRHVRLAIRRAGRVAADPQRHPLRPWVRARRHRLRPDGDRRRVRGEGRRSAGEARREGQALHRQHRRERTAIQARPGQGKRDQRRADMPRPDPDGLPANRDPADHQRRVARGGTSAPRPRRLPSGTATATSGRGGPGTSMPDRSSRSMRCGSLGTASTSRRW